MKRPGAGRTGRPTSAAAEILEPGEAPAAPGDCPAGDADDAPASPDGPEPAARDLTPAPRPAAEAAAGPPGGRCRALLGAPVLRHLLLIVIFTVAGVAVTWPSASQLVTGNLPSKTDVTSYVWGFWWVAHQALALGDPFTTTFMAAPAGIQLGFDTLMPLPGLLFTPVTWAFGPSATFSLLTILTPGLLCYVMFRAARLWLGWAGAVTAGLLFGLSTMLTWQNLYHLNISLGSLFLPLTLETAVRLQRRPRVRTGLALGLVLGTSVLVNQESAVLVVMLAAALLVPWLALKLVRGRAAVRASLAPLAAGAVLATLVAAPQLIAMAQYVHAGGATAHVPAVSVSPSTESVPVQLAQTYGLYGVGLPSIFSPSPRLATYHVGTTSTVVQDDSADTATQTDTQYGFGHVALYAFDRKEGAPTFGAVLTLGALAGLALAWRRGHAWWMALMWLAGAALALGPTIIIGTHTYVPLAMTWQGQRISDLMPYGWLIRVPGLSALREADRLAVLGLMGTALLAGITAQWLWERRRRLGPVIVVLAVLAAAELGWTPGSGNGQTMPTTMPALDRPVMRDHTHSIVLDIPYGLRGGIPLYGAPISIRSLMLATADGHPRAISYSSWVPGRTWDRIARHPFYLELMQLENDAQPPTRQQLTADRRDLAGLDIGWVLIWRSVRPSILNYLEATGFRFDYAADGVTVLRPAQDVHLRS